MTITSAREVQKHVRSLADPAAAVSSARFFKQASLKNDVFLGLRAPTLHQLAKNYRELPLGDVERLLQSKIHEERLLALLILGLVVARADDATRKKVFDLYLANTRYINNWDLVDASAPAVVGGYLADKSRQPL